MVLESLSANAERHPSQTSKVEVSFSTYDIALRCGKVNGKNNTMLLVVLVRSFQTDFMNMISMLVYVLNTQRTDFQQSF